jgi:branched-chain amino acid aminotransferase
MCDSSSVKRPTQLLEPHEFYEIKHRSNRIVRTDPSVLHRLIQYGDGIFESIRIERGRAALLSEHLKRLKQSAIHFKFVDHYSKLSWLDDRLLAHIQKNNQCVRLKIMITRSAKGLYTPRDEKYHVLLYQENIEEVRAKPKETYCAFSEEESFLNPSIYNHKTCNALPYIMAGMEAHEKKLDYIIIHNSKFGILEAHAANFFGIRSNELITPSLESACLNGVCRKLILNWAQEMNLKPIERNIHPSELKEFNECFLSNAVKGIQSIQQIGNLHFEQSSFAFKFQNRYFSLFK